MPTDRYAWRFPPDLRERAEAQAKVEGRPLAQLLTDAVRDYLDVTGAASPPKPARSKRPRPVAKGTRPKERAPKLACAHPVGRRIGDRCGACGTQLR